MKYYDRYPPHRAPRGVFWNRFSEKRARFDKTVKGYINELLELRGRWAHRHTLTPDKTMRFLDTAELLLRAAGADGHAEGIRSRSAALRQLTLSGATDCDSLNRLMAMIPPFPKTSTAIALRWKTVYYAQPVLSVATPSGMVLPPMPESMAFDNTGLRYRPDDIEFVDMDADFCLTPHVDAFTTNTLDLYRRKLQLLYPDSRKTTYSLTNRPSRFRLHTIEPSADRLRLHLQRTSFSCYMQTNLLIDHVTDNRQESLRETVHSNGKLEDLESSHCANSLGVNVLLLTADGQLVFQKRSHEVITFPCRMGPSVSGTLAYEHLYSHTNVADTLIASELGEETALGHRDLHLMTLNFLGIGRDLIRVGPS